MTWAVNLILLAASLLGIYHEHAAPTPATPTALPVLPSPTPAPATGEVVYGHVTHYGESYNGSPLGCPGYGLYSSGDPTIAASAYDLQTGARPYQCGERLEVCGDAACAVVVVVDACPGCGWNHLDLSEAGQAVICGYVGNNCAVSIRRMQ